MIECIIGFVGQRVSRTKILGWEKSLEIRFPEKRNISEEQSQENAKYM